MVVSKQAEPEAVAHERPQVLIRGVQVLLHHAVRAHPCRPGNARRPRVHVDPGTDEVYRNGAPQMGDRVRLGRPVDAAGGQPSRRGKPAVTKLLEERQEPPFSGQSCRRGVCWLCFQLASVAFPSRDQQQPGAVRGFVNPLAAGEVVLVRLQPVDAGIPVGEPLEEVGR